MTAPVISAADATRAAGIVDGAGTAYTIVARHAKPGFARAYRKPVMRRSSPRPFSKRLGFGEGKLRVPTFRVRPGLKMRSDSAAERDVSSQRERAGAALGWRGKKNAASSCREKESSMLGQHDTKIANEAEFEYEPDREPGRESGRGSVRKFERRFQCEPGSKPGRKPGCESDCEPGGEPDREFELVSRPAVTVGARRDALGVGTFREALDLREIKAVLRGDAEYDALDEAAAELARKTRVLHRAPRKVVLHGNAAA